MNNGWIKIYRKLTKWRWYKDSKVLHLFIHLLLMANHKDNYDKDIMIKRGELKTGRILLSIETGITQQSIRTILKKLERSNEIIVKSTNKYSIITIVNFESYQISETETNQQLTNNQPTTNQQLTTNKNVKNDKNDKNDKKKDKQPIPSKSEISKLFSDKTFSYGSEKNIVISSKKLDIEIDKFDLYYRDKWKNAKKKFNVKSCITKWVVSNILKMELKEWETQEQQQYMKLEQPKKYVPPTPEEIKKSEEAKKKVDEILKNVRLKYAK